MSNEAIKNFLDGFSIEVTPRAAAKIDNFAELIPKGTLIYVAHIEGTPIEDMVSTAKKINEQGFKPMPHFPARIIKDKNVLQDWISRYQNEADVKNALLIAGGANKPYGDYDSSIQLIESELFDKSNFLNLHIAGHPEGSTDIDPDGSTKNVDEALSWKNEFSKRTDASMAITTQFSFDSKTVIDWASNLKQSGIDIPIHIGIAGPAKLQTLLRYSLECGVGASIKIIQKRALDLTKLLLPYKPTTIISELANYKADNPDFNIDKVHFFPLGGVKQVSDFVKEF
ncbi:methylenetetrahydrofolate reductase [Gammaproteobacteria bacterium]|nr:methylenetetrahydrofolate reductase [Gammaproteobacteria bacterium]|tara:strand:+ start:68 stop:919 length:852 start_codon:yes stop_codon:yes gene_type:complete